MAPFLESDTDMALAETPFALTHNGEWPGPTVLRRGWARATARPWNDHIEDASLRLVRGGSLFINACAVRLMEPGASSVISTPLPIGGRKPWMDSGFDEHIELALLRLDLDHHVPSPDHLVVERTTESIEELLEIDQLAFDPFWRFDIHGITEAIQATNRSTVFLIRDSNGSTIGFAIVGYGNAISYLQRVAVHPSWQGHGMGRSLVRVAARKARLHGSQAILLNTQFNNTPAISLYESEGYELLPERLALMRFGE